MTEMHTMDVWKRRELLKVEPNPERKIDYVATLSGTIEAASLGATVDIRLRYVPDAMIVRPVNFDSYLAAMGKLDWESLEALATTVLNDVNNETVARWVQVGLDIAARAVGGGPTHQVLVEDHQPEWSNPSLLARLKPV